MQDDEEVFERIAALLRDSGVEYEVLRHNPVRTSEEAANVRGTPLSSGAKALVVKADQTFRLLVLPADRKLASSKARRSVSARKLRFATVDEVRERTGLEPGAIPPFGSLFGLPTTCDPALGAHDRINFNAGHRAISISMAYADYIAVEQPSSVVITGTS